MIRKRIVWSNFHNWAQIRPLRYIASWLLVRLLKGTRKTKRITDVAAAGSSILYPLGWLEFVEETTR
ncbi:hypothetical protein ACHAWU_008708 [Discostella pseudostelligera]|uniref:Uncharacterized protein n=1 Tax=Discostella pseudostelligera TaxID=259834 RepID=A0ABD3M4Z0_9STRA